MQGDLKTVFTDVIEKNMVGTKFVGFIVQQQRATVFNPHMLFNNAQTPTLTQENYTSIVEDFNLENTGNLTKAQILFSLSVLFTTYSSSVWLGTETQSPSALRYYAYALMSKAWESDKSIFPGADMNYEWGGRLLGRGDGFDCASTLASEQSHYAIDSFCDSYKFIVPANLFI